MKSAYFAIAFALLAAGGCASNGDSVDQATDTDADMSAEAAAGGEVAEPAAAATGAVAAEDMPAGTELTSDYRTICDVMRLGGMDFIQPQSINC